jgi:type VI protein secretion system component VasK
MFNTIRQLGGAIGVAVLTTAIVLVGPVHLVGGHTAANLTAYRLAFLVAAAICLVGLTSALRISDAAAARTIPARRASRSERAAERALESEAEPALTLAE